MLARHKHYAACNSTPLQLPTLRQLRSIEKRLQELLNKVPECGPEQGTIEARLEELQVEMLHLTCGQLTVTPMGICHASPPPPDATLGTAAIWSGDG